MTAMDAPPPQINAGLLGRLRLTSTAREVEGREARDERIPRHPETGAESGATRLAPIWPRSAGREAAAVRRVRQADRPAHRAGLPRARLGRAMVRQPDQARLARLQADRRRAASRGQAAATPGSPSGDFREREGKHMILKEMVGHVRFELTTPSTPCWCATRLR